MAHVISFRTTKFDVTAETPNPINPIAGQSVEWVVQVHRHRSMSDKLFGRNKMTEDDPLVALIERIMRGDPMLSDVSVEREG